MKMFNDWKNTNSLKCSNGWKKSIVENVWIMVKEIPIVGNVSMVE
jgi:hypothetical protein